MRPYFTHALKYGLVALASLGALLLVAAAEVQTRPDAIYYHDKGSHWQTVCLLLVLLTFISSLVVRVAPIGAGLMGGGGATNVIGRKLWHGSPDYLLLRLPEHKIFLFNFADVTILIGALLLVWAAAKFDTDKTPAG